MCDWPLFSDEWEKMCDWPLFSDEWDKMCDLGLIVLLGFALNYLPYFVIDHTFFLHHYLPAYVFAVLMAACVVDHAFVLLG